MAEQVTCPRCGGSGTVRNGREVGCARCLATLRVDPYDLSARPVRHVKFDQTPRPCVHAEAECALGKFTALFPKEGAKVIQIHESKTADTRSCDYANTTKQTLLESSVQHIGDVQKALAFFSGMIADAARRHDTDKITDIDGFHADFVTGFKEQEWWTRHRRLNRHHLFQADGVPADVNLIDVLDLIADCVMAGMARTGSVYPLNIDPDVLMRAFQNTVEQLKAQVVVVPKDGAQ